MAPMGGKEARQVPECTTTLIARSTAKLRGLCLLLAAIVVVLAATIGHTLASTYLWVRNRPRSYLPLTFHLYVS